VIREFAHYDAGPIGRGRRCGRRGSVSGLWKLPRGAPGGRNGRIALGSASNIKHKHVIFALLTRFCLLIKVLEPLETCIVISLAIGSHLDDPVVWNAASRVLSGKMESARNVEER
jgi:hypothetical protein